jgi:hypothetical protein
MSAAEGRWARSLAGMYCRRGCLPGSDPPARRSYHYRAVLLDGLASGAQLPWLSGELEPLHRRDDERSGEVFLHVACQPSGRANRLLVLRAVLVRSATVLAGA